MTELEALEALLRTRSLQRGEFVLASGSRSSVYVDARKTTMSAQGLHLIGRLGLRAIREAGWVPSAVGGLTMGADPVAFAIAHASMNAPPVVDGFSVRKAPKEHGSRQRIEGNLRAGQSVVVVEDVVTTGGSARAAVSAVQDLGATVLGVLAVVDREEQGREALEAAGLKVVALTTITALLAPGPTE